MSSSFCSCVRETSFRNATPPARTAADSSSAQLDADPSTWAAFSHSLLVLGGRQRRGRHPPPRICLPLFRCTFSANSHIYGHASLSPPPEPAGSLPASSAPCLAGPSSPPPPQGTTYPGEPSHLVQGRGSLESPP